MLIILCVYIPSSFEFLQDLLESLPALTQSEWLRPLPFAPPPPALLFNEEEHVKPAADAIWLPRAHFHRRHSLPGQTASESEQGESILSLRQRQLAWRLESVVLPHAPAPSLQGRPVLHSELQSLLCLSLLVGVSHRLTAVDAAS